MKHIIKYRFKVMMRNKTLVFWSIIFPIALMTMFGMVLRNSYSYSEFDTIPIAIVENDAWEQNTALKQVLKESTTGDAKLFDVRTLSEEEAKSLLKDDKISAYVVCGKEYSIHVATSGYNQTITQTFFDEYLQKENMVTQMMMNGASIAQIQSLFEHTLDYIEINGDSNTDMTNVYFYTGLAMSAIFGGMWAITAINDIQADQSLKGARISLAPTNKAIHLISALILNLFCVFIILCIQFAYVYYMFDINFGNDLPYMFLILMAGDIAGSALGTLVGTTFTTKNPEAKVGMLSSITLFCSFLAGMMIVQMKWIVQEFAPILGYINPVNMITDSLYRLYYFGMNNQIYFNILCLLVFSIVCYGISFFSLTKKQYKAVGVR